MRLAGIDSIDAANAWLPTFIERHNQRFERAPQSPVDSHRAVLHDREALRLILSHHHTRTLSKNLTRSEEHTSELQSRGHLVCRLLLEKKKQTHNHVTNYKNDKHTV